jgi:orotate phosphoribosyltransferase
VLIIDDVITAGTAIHDAMVLLKANHAQAAGVVIALDRQEQGQGKLSAIQEVGQHYGISVVSIVKLDDLIAYLTDKAKHSHDLAAVHAYRQRYGL